jgi:hypothetical protein
MPRHQKVPYTCPRCGYTSPQKIHMYKHLYLLKKPCSAVVEDIKMTDDNKEYILANRILKTKCNSNQGKEKSPITRIVNNYNQYNTINNIIANMDTVQKLEHFNNYIGNKLIDFESTVEETFKKTSNRLDGDEFTSHYLLKEGQLMNMVEKAAKTSETTQHASHNIIYDAKLKEIKIFEGRWDSMSIDEGTKHCIEVIQRNYLNSYERYLIRNIMNTAHSYTKNLFSEMLISYFKFIACFEIEPYCKDVCDDMIMHPIQDDSDDEDNEDEENTNNDDDIYTSFVSNKNERYDLQEEFYPKYKKIVQNIPKQYTNRIIRSVQEMIKRNSMHNISDLNKKVTSLFHMDETFRDLLLSFQTCSTMHVKI